MRCICCEVFGAAGQVAAVSCQRLVQDGLSTVSDAEHLPADLEILQQLLQRVSARRLLASGTQRLRPRDQGDGSDLACTRVCKIYLCPLAEQTQPEQQQAGVSDSAAQQH